ncbi:MAG: DegT/DnrJ/EryC1/StrS family aminotransferase [Candidatus Roizmanbacteria bacterium]|nr:DegT/DnrJ/EryC1/StrS family aminotransferase [Candidatus Roizmanbacteria bacterium]
MEHEGKDVVFDSRYSSSEWLFGLEPSEELVELIETGKVPLGKALDLGCGEGRDSLFLERIIVDLFGNPVDREAVKAISQELGLHLIEDCAQSTGATFGVAQVGSFGVGCHSFGEIKNITSAEGGMLTTNSSEVYRKARIIRQEGEMWRSLKVSTIDSTPQEFSELIYGIDYPFLGHNYRMNGLQAALGLSQLHKLDELNKMRIRNGQYYLKNLENTPGIILPVTNLHARHVFNRFVMRISEELPLSRDAFLAALIFEGVPAGVYYPVLLNRATIFKEHRKYRTSAAAASHAGNTFPNAERLCREQIILPTYPGLAEADLEDVVLAVKKVARNCQYADISDTVEVAARKVRASYFGQFLTVT